MTSSTFKWRGIEGVYRKTPGNPWLWEAEVVIGSMVCTGRGNCKEVALSYVRRHLDRIRHVMRSV